MSSLGRILSKAARLARGALLTLGAGAAVFLTVAWTGLYQHGERWLATAPYAPDCDYILLLPAGPIPNAIMLMRTYRAAEEWRKNPRAKIIISHATEATVERSTLGTIARELALRGVPGEAVLLETRATNTAEHALYIKQAGYGDPAKDKYLIVTSPTHVRRSLMTFANSGFARLYAAPSSPAVSVEYLGEGKYWRYWFWTSAIKEIEILREFAAIGYYKLRGWA
ncbi:MAG: YdcF family protein [Nitrospinae bacterium]|nr:YdcF family protein [Nitrospinota bacterium]